MDDNSKLSGGMWYCPQCSYQNYLNLTVCNRCKIETRHIPSTRIGIPAFNNPSKKKLCKVCKRNKANGGLKHDSTIHTGICFSCALISANSNDPCPFCNVKHITIIAKIYSSS